MPYGIILILTFPVKLPVIVISAISTAYSANQKGRLKERNDDAFQTNNVYKTCLGRCGLSYFHQNQEAENRDSNLW